MTAVCILGGGWYGCHISSALAATGIEVELHEKGPELFFGASGANPARLHQGQHYPRSSLTRALCRDNSAKFERVYGFMTRGIPLNIYAIAAQDSLIDFAGYREMLMREIELITIHDLKEFGLQNVEGAILTGERHIIIEVAREHFKKVLGHRVRFNAQPSKDLLSTFDWVIDCTFSAIDPSAIDRYEPCVTGLFSGRTDIAVTIMDGPFPSVYPWQEERGLSSFTSASLTPLSKTCRDYREAQKIISGLTVTEVRERCEAMRRQLAHFWPEADNYLWADAKLAVRAMPRSAADARLVDVVRNDKTIQVRAGKIDMIFRAEELVREIIGC